ncbi:MAG TPA: signal recognition particle-docking protein FtsY [Pseudonocardia sp.]
MTQTLWIVVAVVAVLIVVAVVLGLVLRRSRRISLREPEKREELPPRAGSYQAEGGFNFSAGTETPVVERAPTTPPTGPSAAPKAQAPLPAETAAPADTAAAETAPAGTAATSRAATDIAATTTPATTTPATTTPADTAPAADAPVGTAPADATATAGSATDTAATTPADAAADTAAPTTTPTTTGTPTTATPTPADTPSTSAGPATNGVAPSAITPADIAPAEGRMERLRGRLARSRSGFGQSLLALLGAGELDEDSWEDVEAMLLSADLGPEMTLELVDTLRTELARRAVRTTDQARALLRDVLTDALRTDLDRSVRALPHDGRPAVLLVVGVNGTGKTTTTGKLARVLVASGRHVVLGAADTFRAAAAEQLMTWGERAGATVVRGPEGADPASVAFEAVKQGGEEGADAVLLDTAGRLHTKTGLMDELGKVKRVVSRQALVDEVLLVLDATTGQNGLIQARVFGDVVDVTGIVLTKLDGTAKGGIVFRVQRELGVPVKLVGLGEGPDDLAPFEPAAFVDALLD